ncbi:glutathione S-transferase family protein [Enhydrobacter sp.]|uniref:glutathione S-transferase family protein n=1 Tax=Enhydrobacter sp. TaxID=1894999 RepID=UPI0026376C82|nr:glutathione S-transferase family protein [Enhydrobacter sp.]WIM12705.1 MAG: Glutathione S-transferase [Enhydrobacter sp.]
MTSLVLYLAPGSSSMAVHIALHEIGVPFEARPLSFERKETRTPAFLQVNPAGKVPTLLVDGRPLTEVAGCLFYLARRYPEAKLLPAGIEAEAHAVSWMSFIASTLHPARRQGLAHANEVWQIADRRLGTKEWALDDYSIVDMHLFRLFWRMARSLQPPAGSLGNLFAHHDRMMVRPAVQRTIRAEAAIGYELPP